LDETADTGLLVLTVGSPGSLAGVDSDDAVRALEGERTQAAVRIRADGDSIAQIARTLGVAASSVSRALGKKDDETPRYETPVTS
jgi:DNA invertase Pin-like site-specific DNA recombinase